MTRKTCHGCPHLQYLAMPFSVQPGCAEISKDRNNICLVPHRYANGEITFWRVPVSCPLPDSEVQKSEQKPHPKHWVVVPTSQIDEDLIDPFTLRKRNYGGKR